MLMLARDMGGVVKWSDGDGRAVLQYFVRERNQCLVLSPYCQSRVSVFFFFFSRGPWTGGERQEVTAVTSVALKTSETPEQWAERALTSPWQQESRSPVLQGELPVLAAASVWQKLPALEPRFVAESSLVRRFDPASAQARWGWFPSLRAHGDVSV